MQRQEALAANDPLEAINRKVFAFDQKIDSAALEPAAEAYNEVVPALARRGVHNFLTNLNLPVVFANDSLQGDFDQASKAFGRFALNSTFGAGGFMDWATAADLPYHDNDFGLTLARYGFDEGPYLILPFIGPDPPRDIAGQIGDAFLDPTTYISLRSHFWWSVGRSSLSIVDRRARNMDTIEGIERSSIDLYASVRSLYRQHRKIQEHKSAGPNPRDLPDL